MDELLKQILVAASLGALIGLERQWDNQLHHPDRTIPAGLRTFTFWSLMGVLCGYFSRESSSWMIAAGFVAMTAWLTIYIAIKFKREEKGSGMTTAAVGILTYLIGALVAYDHAKIALILSIAILILLAGKNYLHQFSRKFTADDVRMALQFAAVTGIVLPLVPDKDFGPFDGFNLYSIWLMVVIVSGVGCVGYIFVRILGASLGIALTGLIGGIASSTATTLAMSRLSREKPALSSDCALAIVLACTVMLWRVALIVGLIAPTVLLQLWPSLAVMSAPGLAFALLRWAHLTQHAEQGHFKTYENPLSLKVAIHFALIYAVVVFAVKVAQHYLGESGLYAVSFLSGLTDLDAISLTVSKMSQSSALSGDTAAQCIVLAAIANTILKGGFAMTLGSKQLAWVTWSVFLATIALAVGALLWS